MIQKILIFGLPGSGKTTLSRAVSSLLDVEHINADIVRNTINAHLSFSLHDRIIQANTMKILSDNIIEQGNSCVVDFVCPTKETREAFCWTEAFTVFVDRIDLGRFEDTNQLFQKPDSQDCDIVVNNDGRTPEEWANDIIKMFNSQDSVESNHSSIGHNPNIIE